MKMHKEMIAFKHFYEIKRLSFKKSFKITHVPISKKRKKIVALTLPVPYPIGGVSASDHSPHRYLNPIRHINAHNAVFFNKKISKIHLDETIWSLSTQFMP